MIEDTLFFVGTYGELAKWDLVNTITDIIGPVIHVEEVISPVVLDNKIYMGDSQNETYGDKLYEWNGGASWTTKVPAFTEYISHMCVFNGKIYFVSGLYNTLYEWDGLNNWVLKASYSIGLKFLLVKDGNLYVLTSEGSLLQWDGGSGFISKAPILPPGAWTPSSGVVFNNKIYCISYYYGKLFEWNEVDNWILKIDSSNDYSDIGIRNTAVNNGA